ncbi:Gfo/Idh/MocA family oxidoreductase [Rhizobium sp. AQ_MP]|uniref:Gfo/Idh/MocA family protein n=1 Tax=Rhizobium sp. AQ_MP TaxID=2761536 RepID=UPI00163A00D8|nr:Gfo/Idh/MocA family oxidoreductase [Rhizobium sp. AQ_MP]MBC2774579.1 Gfo/Idh/MocA family oxidoreductase [Rhizobium sp. AQ_MP]
MRWGLVGASTIARQYMIAAIRAQHGEVVGVVSASTDRARAFADENQIRRAYIDLTDLLADPEVEAVYISTTNEKHLPQALAAIGAGKHVLCEKPLALALQDAIAMVQAAAEAGLVFATNHHLRCSGSHRTVRALIDSGRIGRVLSLRLHHAVFLPPHLQGWRINAPDAGGGVIPDITVHDADVARFLLGEDPVSVVAQMTASGLGEGVEDSAMSVWTMPSGAMVMSHESFTHPFAGSGLEVHGTEGSIFARDVMTQNPIGSIELVTASGREAIGFDHHDLYAEGVRRFHAAVAGDGEPAATGPDGVKSLAVALAVREAAARGVRIDVNYGGVR